MVEERVQRLNSPSTELLATALVCFSLANAGCLPSARVIEPHPAPLKGEESAAGGPGDQQDGGKTSPPPPPPLAGTGGQPTELRKTAEGTLVCQRERSDLIGSYLEVSIAHPTDPVERALLLAWLEGATAQALTPRETPPCTSGQLCGRLQEGAAADVIQALLHPPLGRFYQTRQNGIERFAWQLTRPGERQLVLGELLLTRDTIPPGDLTQLPGRITGAQLASTWKATLHHTLLTVTTEETTRPSEVLTPGLGTSVTDPDAQKDSAERPEAPGERRGRRLRVAIDQDAASPEALLLWPLPSGTQPAALRIPPIGDEQRTPELIVPPSRAFLGLKLAAASRDALLSSLVDFIAAPAKASAISQLTAFPRAPLDRSCHHAAFPLASNRSHVDSAEGPLALILSGIADADAEVLTTLRQLDPVELYSIEGTSLKALSLDAGSDRDGIR